MQHKFRQTLVLLLTFGSGRCVAYYPRALKLGGRPSMLYIYTIRNLSVRLLENAAPNTSSTLTSTFAILPPQFCGTYFSPSTTVSYILNTSLQLIHSRLSRPRNHVMLHPL